MQRSKRSFSLTRKNLLASAALFLLFILPVQAQIARYVLIGNGGTFGPSNFATVASYDLATQDYQIFDSIPASSVLELLVDGDVAYLTADSFLVRYDLNTWQRTHIANLSGVRRLALHGNHILATRGYGASDSFVQAFDKSDLSPAFTVTGISGQCDGITIWNDTAYVGVTGSFPYTEGRIAVIDLNAEALNREINLDTLGIGIGKLFNDGSSVFSLNAQNFGSSYGVISEWGINSGSLMNHIVNHSLGGGAGIYGDDLYAFFNGALGTFDIPNSTVDAPGIVPGYWAAAVVDTSLQRYFLTETDYYSYGMLKTFDAAGNLLDSLPIGISPEAIALYEDFSTAATPAVQSANETIRAWPNPVLDRLHLEAAHKSEKMLDFFLSDLEGRQLLSGAIGNTETTLDLATLARGAYLLKVRTRKGFHTLKVLK